MAVVLCSDIEITPDTFHRAARGYGVSNEIKQVLLIITYVSIVKIRITHRVYGHYMYIAVLDNFHKELRTFFLICGKQQNPR